MSATVVAVGVFALVFGAALGGMALRTLLPEHHVSDVSKDTVTRAVGLVVTLAGLVLGFMVGAAKGYHDDVANDLKRIAADAAMLDRDLARSGPAADPARQLLRQTMGSASRTLWPDALSEAPTLPAGRPIDALLRLQDLVDALPVATEADRAAQSRARQTAAQLAHAGWQLIELTQTRMQPLLVAILVLWLMLIFLGFGLLAPRNATVLAAFALAGTAAAGALFLILELYDPLHGFIRIPPSVFAIPFVQLGS